MLSGGIKRDQWHEMGSTVYIRKRDVTTDLLKGGQVIQINIVSFSSA